MAFNGQFKKGLTLFLFANLLFSILSFPGIPRAYASDPIDSCLYGLSGKQTSSFASGSGWNVSWTGSLCRAYVFDPIEDLTMHDSPGHIAPYTKDSDTATLLGVVGDHPANNEYRSYVEWSLSWMSWTELNVSEVRLHIGQQSGGSGEPDVFAMTFKPSTASAETAFKDSGNGTNYGDFLPGSPGQKNIVLAGASQELELARNNTQSWWAIGLKDVNVANPTWNYFYSEDYTANNPPTLQIDYNAVYTQCIDYCEASGVSLLNPSAYEDDGIPYVFVGDKYYNYNATWTNINLTRDLSVKIHFSDGEHDVNISYSLVTYLYDIEDGEEYVQVLHGPRSTNYGYDLNSTNLYVIFAIRFKPDILDARNVRVWQYCSDFNGWEASSLYFHIYSKGGYVNKTTVGNASFTDGGALFEMCAYNYGIAQVNITYRMLQHFHTEFAHRFYKNESGAWVPEDQAMQSAWHDDGGEDYGGIHDWDIRFKLHAWDNESQVWNNLLIVNMYMIDGDEGSNDEWTAIKTYWTRGPWNDAPPVTVILVDEAWNAFIEEEPAARYRTWLDLFISNVNASGVVAGRTNAYYHGIQNTGWWMWGDWAPMLNNISESIVHYNLKTYQGNNTVASKLDLMKLEVELEWNADSGSQLFMSCIEDINLEDYELGDTNGVMKGINKPIFVDAKSPDMPATGFLAPLVTALSSMAKWFADALSSVAAMLWAYLGEQIPWFTSFWETVFLWLASAGELFFTIAENLIALFSWGVAQLDYLLLPIQVITETYDTIVTYTGQFLGTDPSQTISVLLLVVVFVPFIEALTVGDTGFIIRSITLVWDVMFFIINISVTFIKFIVSSILEAFPG